MVDESQSNWDENIDAVLMGYRASRQTSTKHSPYFLLFQQQVRLPIDSEMLTSSLDQQEGDQEEDLDQKIQNPLASREAAFEKAETNIAAAQKVQKVTYDRKLSQKSFLREQRYFSRIAGKSRGKGGS